MMVQLILLQVGIVVCRRSVIFGMFLDARKGSRFMVFWER